MKNKKGQLEFGLNWLIQLLLFGILFIAAAELSTGFTGGQVSSDNTARNLGATLDTLAISPYDMQITSSCPSGYTFTIDGDRIQAGKSMLLGDYQGTYYYAHEGNANLPSDVEIDCSSQKTITVEKKIDKSTGVPTIEVY